MVDERALLPYTLLVDHFRAAPPGKLYGVHGGSEVFRLSLSAAAHVLLRNVPIALVDGTNRFDVYYLAEFARWYAHRLQRTILPEHLLRNIFVSRAFTCYQMEAVITDRLPAFVQRKHTPVVIVFGLLDTFYDEQAPLFEVQASIRRIVAALHQLKRSSVSVLLASVDAGPIPPARRGLLPGVLKEMDRVYHGSLVNSQSSIVNCQSAGGTHGTNRTDLHDGRSTGDAKLVQVPPGVAEGRPGGAGRSVPRRTAATCGERLRGTPDSV